MQSKSETQRVTKNELNKIQRRMTENVNRENRNIRELKSLHKVFNIDDNTINKEIAGNENFAKNVSNFGFLNLIRKNKLQQYQQQQEKENHEKQTYDKWTNNIVLNGMFGNKNKRHNGVTAAIEGGVVRQKELRRSIHQNIGNETDCAKIKEIKKRTEDAFNNPEKGIFLNDNHLIPKENKNDKNILETIPEEQKGLNEQNQQSYKKATTMLSNFIGKEVNRNGSQSVVSNNIKYNFFKLKNQLQAEKQLDDEIKQNSLKNIYASALEHKRYQQALQRQKEAMEKEQNKYKNKQSVEQTNDSTTIFPKISNCHKPEATQNAQDLKQEVNDNKFPVNPELNVKEQQIVNEEKKNSEKDYKSRLKEKIDASNKLPLLKQKKNVEEIKEEIKQKELDYVANIVRQKQEKKPEPQKQDPRETSFNGLRAPSGEPFKKAKKNKYKKIFQPRKNFPFLEINYEQVGDQVRQERTRNKKNFRNFSKNCDNMQREADLYYGGDINKLYKNKILNPTRDRRKQANRNIFYYQFNGQRGNIISHNRLINASLNSHKFLYNF